MILVVCFRGECDKYVECTEAEYAALIKPAIDDECIVDGSTCDELALENLYQRPGCNPRLDAVVVEMV